MKFEYCCEGMQRAMGSKVMFNSLLNTIGTCEITFRYCPFCGEKIEITITKVKE